MNYEEDEFEVKPKGRYSLLEKDCKSSEINSFDEINGKDSKDFKEKKKSDLIKDLKLDLEVEKKVKKIISKKKPE